MLVGPNEIKSNIVAIMKTEASEEEEIELSTKRKIDTSAVILPLKRSKIILDNVLKRMHIADSMAATPGKRAKKSADVL